MTCECNDINHSASLRKSKSDDKSMNVDKAKKTAPKKQGVVERLREANRREIVKRVGVS